MKFKIKRSNSTSQPYYFTIVSGSNTLAHSETYVSKQSVKDAIAVIQGGAGSATVEDDS